MPIKLSTNELQQYVTEREQQQRALHVTVANSLVAAIPSARPAFVLHSTNIGGQTRRHSRGTTVLVDAPGYTESLYSHAVGRHSWRSTFKFWATFHCRATPLIPPASTTITAPGRVLYVGNPWR